MTVTLTNETKVNTISLGMESKERGETWDSATYTWDEATGTWNVPSAPFVPETKVNTISLTLETK